MKRIALNMSLICTMFLMNQDFDEDAAINVVDNLDDSALDDLYNDAMYHYSVSN